MVNFFVIMKIKMNKVDKVILKEPTYSKSEYNKEPVYFCSKCLSLRILTIGKAQENYCDSCGSMKISSSSFEEWENKYINKYGHKYVNTKENNSCNF